MERLEALAASRVHQPERAFLVSSTDQLEAGEGAEQRLYQ
jgi:hypothetical protein